ncbi:MAG: hypothetical protein ACYTGB_08390, partial [Planctomycetota bacterium]
MTAARLLTAAALVLACSGCGPGRGRAPGKSGKPGERAAGEWLSGPGKEKGPTGGGSKPKPAPAWTEPAKLSEMKLKPYPGSTIKPP